MATAIQRRRGTTAQHSSFTGIAGEITVDTDKNTVVVHDGSLAGGFPLAHADSLGLRNRLMNGDFSVAQRGTTFDSTTTPANNDDTYLLDRWYVLSDGNDIVDVTQQSDGAVGDLNYIRLDVETVSKKFGIAQIIERANVKDLIGGSSKVSLSFNAKVSNASAGRLDNIKAGIITWSGTADSVTSDIISAWNAEDTDPTLIANATFENTPANLSVTTSDARYKIENITIDTASAANIIVFIWADGLTATLTDTLEISNIQLEKGSVATDFEHRPYAAELALCQRYFQTVQKSIGVAVNTTGVQLLIPFPVEMRSTPTFSQPATIEITDAFASNHTQSSTGLSANNATTEGVRLSLNNFGGLTQQRVYMQITNNVWCDAEL